MREDGIELTETKVEASHKQQPARRHKEEKASVNKPKASLSSTSGAASSPFFTTPLRRWRLAVAKDARPKFYKAKPVPFSLRTEVEKD